MRNSPGIITANLACFLAMFMWAFAFPASEVLLQSWGIVALLLARTVLAVGTLTIIWLWIDGFEERSMIGRGEDCNVFAYSYPFQHFC